MQNQNSFSINLEQQKAIANKRLKAIRQSDASTLEQVRKYHSQPDTLSFATVQLADVQHALARELGLPSWSKLKAHVENLKFHKHAISAQKQALDHDLKTLHVRCGHDIQQLLKEREQPGGEERKAGGNGFSDKRYRMNYLTACGGEWTRLLP